MGVKDNLLLFLLIFLFLFVSFLFNQFYSDCITGRGIKTDSSVELEDTISVQDSKQINEIETTEV